MASPTSGSTSKLARTAPEEAEEVSTKAPRQKTYNVMGINIPRPTLCRRLRDDGPRVSLPALIHCVFHLLNPRPLGLSSPPETASGGDDLVRLSQAPASGRASRLWGWVSWLFSVLAAATVLSYIMSRFGASSLHDHHAPVPAQIHQVSPVLEPTRIHRRSTCESGGVATEEYDMPLHGSAILIIWFVSTSACGFPILANRVPGLRIPGRFFFIVRHFGTGVLIATAFVHLLPTAFLSLGDPCLGSFWTTDYPAMPGAIALFAIFFVTVIEMIFHPGRHCTSGSPVKSENDVDPESVTSPAPASPVAKTDMGRPIHGRTTSIGRGLAQIETRQMDAEGDATRLGVLQEPKHDAPTSGSETSSQHELSEEQKRRQQRLQVIMLEMGILFHSVFIGMALSVSTGSPFIILLIAIIFHRTSCTRSFPNSRTRC
jgi:solute carrier family 39 (zinc transporter), member 1/2/3